MRPKLYVFAAILLLVCVIAVLRFAGTGKLAEQSESRSSQTSEPRKPNTHSPPTPRFRMSKQEVFEADARGELLGGSATSTPEKLLYDILELRAEPYAPLVLDKMEESFALFNPDQKLKAAILLHRYHRKMGTDYLKELIRTQTGKARTYPAAAALAMARDPESIPLLKEVFASYIGDPEFASAIMKWKHPALIEAARELWGKPSAPQGIIAQVLAMAGDEAVLESLRTLLKHSGVVDPENFIYEAALVRLGAENPEDFMQRMRDTAAKANRYMGSFLKQSMNFVGPDSGLDFVTQLAVKYAEARAEFGAKYEKYEAEVQAGLRSRLPSYPRMEEMRFKDAIDILEEWKIPSSAEPVYKALEAAQGGVYVELFNRRIMKALVLLDPDNHEARFQALGFSAEEISAAQQLSKLNPIPHLFRPRQQTIALSKPSPP